MENILHDLKRAGLVRTQRGASGGYWLALPPDEIWLAGIIRAVEGPLANVRGEWPEAVEYTGAAEHLQDVWIAVRASMRTVLESVTLADLVNGELPTRSSNSPATPKRGCTTSCVICPKVPAMSSIWLLKVSSSATRESWRSGRASLTAFWSFGSARPKG
jgi:DNA-binding IscR family transcriptional regulator